MKTTVASTLKFAAANGKEYVIKAGWRLAHFAEKNGLTEYSVTALAELFDSAQTQLAAHLQTRANVEQVGKVVLRTDGEGDEITVIETVNVRYKLGETEQHLEAAQLLNDKATGHKVKGADFAAAAGRYKARITEV